MINYRIKISDLEELYDSIETSWAYVLVTMVSNYRKEASDDYIIVPGNKLKEIIDSCPGPESRRLIEISKRVEDEEEDDLSIFRLAHIYCGGVICDSSKKEGTIVEVHLWYQYVIVLKTLNYQKNLIGNLKILY